MTVSEVEMTDSPTKRKRGAPIPDFEEGWDTESLQVESVPSRKKKARFHLLPIDDDDDDDDDDDSASNVAASSGPSLVDANTGTVTVADTESPLTEVSTSGSKSKPRLKKYHCTFPDCNKAFDRPIRLQTHINTHTGERPHQCPQDDCDKSFYKPEHLKRHLKEKHGDSSFVCAFEARNEETGIIGPCGRVFESANKLKRHIAAHEDKEETTCSWEGCAKIFRKQETLQRHIKKDHLNEDSYICTRAIQAGGTCGQSFPTPGQLKGHEAREHNAPKYVCDICSNETPVFFEEAVTELDPAFLPTFDELQGPTEDVNSNIFSTLSLEDIQPESIRHPGGVIGFPTYHELQRHNKVCHPPTCEQCGKQCKSNKDLTAHIDIEHPPFGGFAAVGPQTEKKYVCPYEDCARSVPSNGFSKKGNMDVHIKSAHTKIKDFVCGTFDLAGNQKVEGWDGQGCGLACANKQSLIGHIRTQHLRIPAALGIRTGLREQDKKRMTRTKGKAKTAEIVEDAMALNGYSGNSTPSQALSMLTGVGYEELRPHACLLASDHQGCQMRFTNEYELGMHMELTHMWNVDDINDALNYGSQMRPSADKGDIDDILRHRLEPMMYDESMDMVDPQLQGFST